MKYVLLSEKFYEDFKDCPEIERKQGRPYIEVIVEVDGIRFGVPLRSSIKHPYALLTDRENGCGLDFSKSVVIIKEEYIEKNRRPKIRENEYKYLMGKDYIVKQKLKKYIRGYKKAKENPGNPRNRDMLLYSTLKYFEEYLSKL